MNCPSELSLSMYADAELPEEQQRFVLGHLEACARCRASYAALDGENALLRVALDEAPFDAPESIAFATKQAPRAPLARAAHGWLWAGAALVAGSPLFLQWVWALVPSLPASVSWLGEWGASSGLLALARAAWLHTTDNQDLLSSSFGFAATIVTVLLLLIGSAQRRNHLWRWTACVWTACGSLLAVPSPSLAADVRYEDGGTVQVGPEETVEDTLFLSGKYVIIEGTVHGDVYAAGERVDIRGEIRGNVYGAGEAVVISGYVAGSIHAAGKDIELAGRTDGALYAAGQNVVLTERCVLAQDAFLAGESIRVKGRLARNFSFAGEQVEVTARVARDVRGYGERFALTSDSEVGGDVEVTVSAEEAARIDPAARVGGETRVDVHVEEEKRDFLHAGFYLSVLARALALLLFGLVLVTAFPSLRPPPPGSSLQLLRRAGIGFVALVVAPFAALLLALTVIGLPLAVVLMMLYVTAVYAATLVIADFASERLRALVSIPALARLGLALLGLLLLFELPLIGGGLRFLVCLFGLGSLLVHGRARYAEWRHQLQAAA